MGIISTLGFRFSSHHPSMLFLVILLDPMKGPNVSNLDSVLDGK